VSGLNHAAITAVFGRPPLRRRRHPRDEALQRRDRSALSVDTRGRGTVDGGGRAADIDRSDCGASQATPVTGRRQTSASNRSGRFVCPGRPGLDHWCKAHSARAAATRRSPWAMSNEEPASALNVDASVAVGRVYLLRSQYAELSAPAGRAQCTFPGELTARSRWVFEGCCRRGCVGALVHTSPKLGHLRVGWAARGARRNRRFGRVGVQ
jgi:hypothetical protein